MTAFIHPTAIVENACIGDHTYVWHFAHIRSGASIGEHCVIAKDVYIDAGVHIGNRCKIQNGVSVYHGVTLEDDVFVGPNVSFTNDKRPRATGEWAITPTLLKRGASIGAAAVLVAGITVGEFAMVGAGSVVTHDVLPYTLVFGSPAVFQEYICPRGHTLKQGVCEQCHFVLPTPSVTPFPFTSVHKTS